MSDVGDPSAVHGWGCTPTENPSVPGVIGASQNTTASSSCLPFARGWRRNILYIIIMLLTILVFVNIALTLWIITILRLNISGIGPIKIIRDGIQLEGQAAIMDQLIASHISSPIGQPINIKSYKNLTIAVSNDEKHTISRLTLKRDKVECSAKVFDISDDQGNSMLRATKEEIHVNTDTLNLEGSGGVNVKSAVQTPLVRAPPAFDLKLESQTRSLELKAPQSIVLESRAGSIDINSHKDIKLHSMVGAIKFDAPNIIISNLKEAVLTDKPIRNKHSKIKIYQLCVCASGKLFLAAPDGFCVANNDDTELCR